MGGKSDRSILVLGVLSRPGGGPLVFGGFGEAAMPAVPEILRDEYGGAIVCGLEPRFGVLRVAEGVGEESAGELGEGDRVTINDAMKALAEALEPRPFFDMPPYPDDGEILISNEGFWQCTNSDGCVKRPADFIYSEEASARLLDAMPMAGLTNHNAMIPAHWFCHYDRVRLPPVGHADRKTAVFLAALAWKGIERPDSLRCSDKEGER